MAAGRAGAAVGAEGACRQADLRVRDRRHDRRAQEPRGDRGLSHRLLAVQRHAAGQVFSARRQLADARPLRSAAVAAGGRAPGAVSRRHLLLHRSRSAVGDQADQEGLDGAARSVQAALHRPGDHDPRRRARHQVHVHHAEAARVAVPGARRARQQPGSKRASRASFRAAPSSRRSGRGSASRSCLAARRR